MTGRGVRAASIGGILGCVVGGLLAARLIQVQTEPGRGGLWFALIYGVLLMSPFVWSLSAIKPTPLRRGTVWLAAALLASLLSLTSLGGATFPLLIPAAFLATAGIQSRSSARAHGGGAA